MSGAGGLKLSTMKKTTAKLADYKSAGVDIKKAQALVHWIKKHTGAPLGLSFHNDYASLFPFPLGGYKNPVLAASTDGVGTKVKLAAYFDEWGGLGQDLLAMCVNDLICTGAQPLFFLDYYACGRLNQRQAKAFLKGLNKACRTANCPLVGGETAEMPGLYTSNDIDCAGFCVGVVEQSRILSSSKLRAGDKIIGLKSAGFHSNGYSLLRKIYNSPADLKKHKKSLLKPTRLYTFLSPLFEYIKGLRAMAHITGGGLNNLSRIIPPHLVAQLEPWRVPACFLSAKQRAGLSWKNLLQVFNCGLGLVLIVKDPKQLARHLPKEEIIPLGHIEENRQKGGKWHLSLKDMARQNS